MIDKCFF
jgi:dephospho-CoA kinase